ncbi:MAG: DUF3467 domain-containing protein [Patescibacteria group bacterium]|nr:DUF3467 domain-containing protein [Patescibacteria group bacterium]
MDQPNQPGLGQGGPQEISIKITDEVMEGRYANMMRVSHTKEEFIMDYANIVPPHGIMTARVITSPGHMKRILKALQDNIDKYEESFGPINEAEAPKGIPFPSI